MHAKLHNLRLLDRRQILAIAAVGLFLCTVFAGLMGGQRVAAATSSTLNFQARLMSGDGSIVPDGRYGIEFKLYDIADGGATAQGVCDGSCVWVETRTGANAVNVVNGYVTVNLGSVSAFGKNINWNQELWLTMNVGGTGGAPKWDGEMSPRLKLTAVPYAFQAGQLAQQDGTNTSTLGFGVQTGSNSLLLPDESGVLCVQGSSDCGFVKNGDALNVDKTGVSINGTLSISDLGVADTLDFLCYNSTGQISVCDLSGIAEFAASGLNATNLDPTALVSSGPEQVFGADGSVSGVDAYTAVAVNAAADGLRITVPIPGVSKQKIGRVLYITTAADSREFTLVLGGTAIEVVIKANSTVTLVWNGAGWTVSDGASTADADEDEPAVAEPYIGSMYYDATTGNIQCYETGGWGACAAAPDNIVSLNPEYAGGIVTGDGLGTLHADFCSNADALMVNAALCTPGHARNFYRWTSPEVTAQTRSIYVTYQLPANFKGFASDNTVRLTARVDNTFDASVTYEMYRSTGSDIVRCAVGANATDVIAGGGGVADTWVTYGIDGNEATGCGFDSSSAGHTIIFKINLTASNNASAYVSTLSFVTTTH